MRIITRVPPVNKVYLPALPCLLPCRVANKSSLQIPRCSEGVISNAIFLLLPQIPLETNPKYRRPTDVARVPAYNIPACTSYDSPLMIALPCRPDHDLLLRTRRHVNNVSILIHFCSYGRAALPFCPIFQLCVAVSFLPIAALHILYCTLPCPAFPVSFPRSAAMPHLPTFFQPYAALHYLSALLFNYALRCSYQTLPFGFCYATPSHLFFSHVLPCTTLQPCFSAIYCPAHNLVCLLFCFSAMHCLARLPFCFSAIMRCPANAQPCQASDARDNKCKYAMTLQKEKFIENIFLHV